MLRWHILLWRHHLVTGLYLLLGLLLPIRRLLHLVLLRLLPLPLMVKWLRLLLRSGMLLLMYMLLQWRDIR